MPLYLCMVPNHGARIGHQSWEYFFLVNYCKKFGFFFVFHEFLANSKILGAALQFDSINPLKFTDPFIQSMTRLSLKDLPTVDHNTLLELHARDENILLHDRIGGNEYFTKVLKYRPTKGEENHTRQEYALFYANKYPRKVDGPYICIHIRRGDIVGRKGRFLETKYFLDKYKYLVTKIERTDLPVFAVTEQNFDDEDLLKNEIPGVHIVKCNEVDAFYYLVNCDYLIASPSGFSNLAHFLGNMKIVVPPDWKFMDHNRI